MDELLKKDLVEGREAFNRFDALVGKVLTVSRKEIARRDTEHKKRSATSGNKGGPKPKQTDAYHAPDVETEAEA